MTRLALVAVLLVACAPATNAPDAGDPGTPDAGETTALPDAGDETTPDAGSDTPDAGNLDPGCTASACEVMIASCGVQLNGEPWGRCADRGLTPPAGFSDLYAERYCVPVCAEFHDGTMVQCFASHGVECLQGEGGRVAAQEACIPYSPTVPEASCKDACTTTRTNCELACPLTSFMDCMDCELGCGIAWQHCANDCPRVARD